MAERHGVTFEQANEALADPDALVFDPDYASQSGRSAHDRLVEHRWPVTDGHNRDGGRRDLRRQRLAGQ